MEKSLSGECITLPGNVKLSANHSETATTVSENTISGIRYKRSQVLSGNDGEALKILTRETISDVASVNYDEPAHQERDDEKALRSGKIPRAIYESAQNAAETTTACTQNWSKNTHRSTNQKYIYARNFSKFAYIIDVLSFFAVGVIMYILHHPYTKLFEIPHNYTGAICVYSLVCVLLFERFGYYSFDRLVAWPRKMFHLGALMAITFALLVALAFAFKISEDFSRVWAFSTFIVSTLVITISRGLLLSVLRRCSLSGRLQRNLAIVGVGPQAANFIECVRQDSSVWNQVVGVFDDRTTRIQRELSGFAVRGNIDELVAWVRRGLVDSVVIALPWSADDRVFSIVQQLRELPVSVYVAPDLVASTIPTYSEEILSSARVLKVASVPMSGWKMVIKILQDKVLAFGLLIVLAPVFLAIAIAIKLESTGPVIFRQRRYGFNNEEITVRKFRTMYHARSPENHVRQATRNDPRITPIGRFLRRTSLDELPQLLNVLDGSMSLVGPRPHAVEHNEKYAALISGYYRRHNVKPGITGMAQIKGFRGETECLNKMEERIQHDVYYLENWSLLMDIEILFSTFKVIWDHQNAY